jgi:hypothetical protein
MIEKTETEDGFDSSRLNTVEFYKNISPKEMDCFLRYSVLPQILLCLLDQVLASLDTENVPSLPAMANSPRAITLLDDPLNLELKVTCQDDSSSARPFWISGTREANLAYTVEHAIDCHLPTSPQIIEARALASPDSNPKIGSRNISRNGAVERRNVNQ